MSAPSKPQNMRDPAALRRYAESSRRLRPSDKTQDEWYQRAANLADDVLYLLEQNESLLRDNETLKPPPTNGGGMEKIGSQHGAPRAWSTEPVDVLVQAALNAVRTAGRPLRERGWNATVEVEAADVSDDHFYDVVLRIRISSPGPIPNEARR